MTLSEGLVGKLDYNFEVFCHEKGVAELVVKAYGKGNDDIKVLERIHLDGAGARGLAKSRIVLSDKAKAEVRGETYGNAPDARGSINIQVSPEMPPAYKYWNGGPIPLASAENLVPFFGEERLRHGHFGGIELEAVP